MEFIKLTNEQKDTLYLLNAWGSRWEVLGERHDFKNMSYIGLWFYELQDAIDYFNICGYDADYSENEHFMILDEFSVKIPNHECFKSIARKLALLGYGWPCGLSVASWDPYTNIDKLRHEPKTPITLYIEMDGLRFRTVQYSTRTEDYKTAIQFQQFMQKLNQIINARRNFDNAKS